MERRRVSSGTMRAALLVAPRRIEVRVSPRPVPGKGEALVRILAVGVCRSDMHYFLHGKISGQTIKRYPQALGHEPAGIVQALGPGVSRPRVGTRVAIEPAVPCGRCVYCRRGQGNVCGGIKFLGMPGLPGALAEFLVMPAHALFEIPDNVSFPVATALEPMAIGKHAVGLVGKKRIGDALVVGAGPVGLCTLIALKLRQTRVAVADYLPERLRMARKLGADAVLRARRGAPAAATALKLGRKFDAVFEAGGTEEAVNLSLQAAAPAGTVALIGIPEGDTIRINPHAARRKELAVLNVRRSNNELSECIKLAGAGKIDLAPMITHAGGLSAAQRIFAMAAGYRGGVIKAVILPGEV